MARKLVSRKFQNAENQGLETMFKIFVKKHNRKTIYETSSETATVSFI